MGHCRQTEHLVWCFTCSAMVTRCSTASHTMDCGSRLAHSRNWDASMADLPWLWDREGQEERLRAGPHRLGTLVLHCRHGHGGVTAVLTNRKQLRMLGSTLLPPKAATSPSCRGTWMASWSRTPRCRWSHRPPAFATWLKRSAVGWTGRQALRHTAGACTGGSLNQGENTELRLNNHHRHPSSSPKQQFRAFPSQRLW